MTPDNLRSFGEALFGPRWQRDLARELDVNERLVRWWAAGERATPPWLPERLDAVLIARITKLVAKRRDLKQLRQEAA